jgi:hypothetical protein
MRGSKRPSSLASGPGFPLCSTLLSHGLRLSSQIWLYSVLMQWAEGGSLDDYIDARLGRPTHVPHPTSHHASAHEDESLSDIHSRSARIRAFRAMQRASPSEKSSLRAKLNNNGHAWTAVHLLSTEEVLGIFGGVAAGLGFLVGLSPSLSDCTMLTIQGCSMIRASYIST